MRWGQEWGWQVAEPAGCCRGHWVCLYSHDQPWREGSRGSDCGICRLWLLVAKALGAGVSVEARGGGATVGELVGLG